MIEDQLADPPLPRYHDLTGQVFSRLTVLSYEGKRNHDSLWLCRCSCGKEKTIRYSGLVRGKSTSCGCYRREVHAKRRERPEGHQRTQSNPLWRIWSSMKTRCYNHRNPSYRNYGMKGIKMCQRWLDSFDAFVDDMGPRPEGASIDRIDVNGDCTPENCHWASRFVQAANTRRVLKFDWKGENLCLTEICRRENVSYHSVYFTWRKYDSLESCIEAIRSKGKTFKERANIQK